jgi:hypothetical protein
LIHHASAAEPVAGDTDDPGTGYDVVNILAELIPCCPIIIQTSNSERGTRMQGALSLPRWQFDPVYPLGDD